MASDDESNVSYHSEDECQNYSDSESANHLTKGSSLEQLKSLREKVNWEDKLDREKFRRKLYRLIRNWQGQLPNLRDIFRREEIDLLIIDCVTKIDSISESFVNFVLATGYKDEPDVDEDGKPLLLRTTAVHWAFRRKNFSLIQICLFQIYNRFDVNYIDEDGLTHFHVACMSRGCNDVVKNFLELGQNPNILLPETGDSPLHFALKYRSKDMTELLLRYGANPNWANKKGRTPLHLIDKYDVTKVFFRINDERCQVLQIDARDKDGNTPLHFAVSRGDGELATMLLKNSADSNSANKNGATPLHFISMRYFDHHLTIAKLFFKMNDELNQIVKIDAKDKLGRTPLQWAVANFSPSCIDVLLDHGAELSSFVFPSASDFDEFFEENWYDGKQELCAYRTSAALCVIERLENRGYELNRSDTLTFMTFLVEHGAFKKPAHFEEFKYENETLLIVRCDVHYEDDYYYEEDEEDEEVGAKKFAAEAKKITISPNLSLYDLIRLRPKEAAKQLTYEDFYKLRYSGSFWYNLRKKYVIAIELNLCEKLSRGFFRRWALDPLMELTRYQLPILCCEMIVEQLMNQDLCNICLAAASPSS